jgi:GNAT superfamily N-acetyltransferase
MAVHIKRVPAGDDWAGFLAVSAEVYQRDPWYLPQTAAPVIHSLARPEFAGRQEAFVGHDDGRPAARVVARISPAMKDEAGRPLGLLGFFEATQHPALVHALFEEALGWLRAQGVATVLGPMDGDTWHKYRLNIGPHDTPPFLMEPHNPDYYPALWEENGFAVLEHYYSKTVDDLALAARETARIAERALKHGYRLRPLRRDRLADELAVIHAISCRIFAKNRFYTDIPLPEFLSLYEGVEALLADGLNWFAQDERGEDVGFVFTFPDRFRAMQAMGGRRDLLAKLKFLLLRNRTDTVNIKSLGVVPEHQRTGIALSLMHRIYTEAQARGFRRANLCLIREGNASGKMDGGAGRLLRRYALYQRVLP